MVEGQQPKHPISRTLFKVYLINTIPLSMMTRVLLDRAETIDFIARTLMTDPEFSFDEANFKRRYRGQKARSSMPCGGGCSRNLHWPLPTAWKTFSSSPVEIRLLSLKMEVIERGNHHELLKLGGFYPELLSTINWYLIESVPVGSFSQSSKNFITALKRTY